MKKMIFSALALVAFATNSNAQATTQASAEATIVTPISIVKDVDMNFGNVAVQAATGGTVVLATDGTRLPGGAGGVTLPIVTGTVSAASFTVSGTAGYAYNVTLPSPSVTLTRSSGGQTMTASNFTSDPTTNTGVLDATTGNQTLNVGATLNVAAGQVAGVYTCASFDVTVNYN